MPSINGNLLDKIIRFQVDLRRMEAGTRKKAFETLQSLQKELIQELSRPDDLSSLPKYKIAEILSNISPILIEHYSQIDVDVQADITGVAKLEVKEAARALKSTVFINTDVNTPTRAVIDRLSNPLVMGGPMSGWWNRQRDTLKFKFGNEVRQGILLGETNQQIIQRIIGRGDMPGIMRIARSDAAALVHTSVHQVANDARQAVYDQNDDIIKSFVWFTALDSHVCKLCMGRSGLKWRNNEDKTPINHPIPFQVPPIHYNDRCVLLPETLTFEEMGIDLPEMPASTRASSFGQVDANITFDQYLSRLPKTTQNEMLGVGRAELWRDGKISLSQLLDGQGRELTLQQLEQKYL
jgi:hypothetical protein